MKNKNVYWCLGLAAVLILGCLLGASVFPKEIEKAVYVDKTVTVTETVEKLVPLDLKVTYLDPAVKEFFKEDLEMCGGDEYDEDQISVKKIEDWSVSFEEKDYTVGFEVKLKYLDKDTEVKCYETYDVSVFYEEDEKPEVSF